MKTKSRYGIGTKALSLFMSVLMTFSVVAVGITPLTETVAHAAYATSYPQTANRLREFYYPEGTKFVYELAMYYSSSDNASAKQGLIDGGYVPVGGNFNASDGHSSKYVYLGVKYQTSPVDTVRAFRVDVNGTRPNSKTSLINGSTSYFYKVGSGTMFDGNDHMVSDRANASTYTFVPNVLDGCVDLNAGTGDTDNLTLYATTDFNAALPITDIDIAYNGDADTTAYELINKGYTGTNGAIVVYFDDTSDRADCNRDCGGDYLYMGYKSSVELVDTSALRTKMKEVAGVLNAGTTSDELVAAMEHAIDIVNDYDEEPANRREGYSTAYNQAAIDQAYNNLEYEKNQAIANSFTSDFKFIVPEAIYLAPNSTSFKYYVNNDSTGAVVSGLSHAATATTPAGETSGKIYYNYSGAATATLSYQFYNTDLTELSGGSITVSSSINSGDTGVSITGGTAPSNASGYIIWTLTYTDANDSNQVKKAVAMTYVYSVYMQSIAAGAKNDADHGTQVIVWFEGVHGYTTTKLTTATWSSGSSLGTTAKYGKRYGASATTTTNPTTYFAPMYNEIGEYATNKNLEEWLTDSQPTGVEGTICYGSADTDDSGKKWNCTAVTGYTALITVDSSRYTNLNQIPNLKGGAMCTDYTNDYGTTVGLTTTYYNGYEAANDTFHNSYLVPSITAKGEIYNDSNKHGILSRAAVNYDWTTGNTDTNKFAIASQVSDKKAAQGITRARYGCAAAYQPIKVTKIDKSGLRDSVQTAISLMPQFGVTGYSDGYLQSLYFGGDQTWKDFSDAFRDASKALTKLDGSCDASTLKSNLDSAITQIKTQVYFSANHDDIGTNLWAPADITSGQVNGITCTYDAASEVITINGTQSASRTLITCPFIPESGATYTVKVTLIGGTYTSDGCLVLEASDKNNSNLSTRINLDFSGTASKTWTFSADSAAKVKTVRLWCWDNDGEGHKDSHNVFTNYRLKVKIEKTGSATTYSTVGRQTVIGSNAKRSFEDLPDGTNVPTRTGYTFNGWSNSPYAEAGSSSVKVGISTTVYAAWLRNSSSLTVKPNTGSWKGTTSDTTTTMKYLDTLSIPVPNKEGYVFTGWTRSGTNGSLSSLTTDATYTFGPTKDATDVITAGWRAAKYNIAYHNNAESYSSTSVFGGNTATSEHTYDTAKALTSNGFTMTNKVTYVLNGGALSGTSNPETVSASFNNWKYTYTDKEGNSVTATYGNGESVENVTTVDGSTLDFYAQWNYGKASCPTPTRTGYTFAGWYSTSGFDSGTQVTNATQITEDTTLYAKWIINTNGLYIDSNGGASQNNLVYLKDGASTYSGGSTSTVTFTSEYEADGDLKITGKRYKTTSGETTANPIGYVYLENGKTYTISYKTTNQCTDFYMFSPVGNHCNAQGGTKYCESIGNGLYETVLTFTVGVASSDCTWQNVTDKSQLTGVYYMRIDQDNYVGDGSYTVTDFRIVEVTQGTGVDNHITQQYNTTRTIANPIRTGYNFTNWSLTSNAAGGSISQTTGSNGRTTSSVYTFGPNNVPKFDVITANWNPITYSVRYNNNSETYPNGTFGGTAVANSSHTYDTAANLNRNTFTRTNTVTYDLDGGSFTDGKSTTETVSSKFIGWDTKKNGTGTRYGNYANQGVVSAINLTTTDNATVDLYAQWEYDSAECPTPSRIGYTFAGWYNGSTLVDASTPVSKDVTYKAKWNPITYYIDFDSNQYSGTSSPTGSTASVTATYDINATLTSNGFTRPGYYFNGWNSKTDGTGTSYTNGATVKNLASTQNAHVTLYAQWVANTYKVAYNANRGSGNHGTGNVFQTTHKYDTETAIASNSFTRYNTVTFDYNGADGNCSTTSANAVSTFNGWKTSGGVAVLGTGKNGTDGWNDLTTGTDTVTVYAQWTYGKITLPTSPTKTGYLFDGWYSSSDFSGGSALTGNETYSTDVTIYAKWRAIKYSVFYRGIREDIGDASSVSGSTTANENKDYDDEFTLSANGFTRNITLTYNTMGGDAIADATHSTDFDHWYGLAFDPLTKEYTNTTFAAQEKVSKLNATNGGSTTLYAEWKSKEVTLPTPVKPGYTFNYWCSDEACQNQVTLTDGKYSFNKNTTIYANWTENKYNITYNGNGATGGSTDAQNDINYTAATKLNSCGFTKYYTITYDVNDSTDDPATLTTSDANTHANQTFTGWSGEVYNPTDRTPGNRIFSASDITTNTYSMLAEPNGATVTLNAQWSTGKITSLPANPTRTGFTFVGWYLNDEGTGDPVTAETAFSGDTTVYAKWTENTYNVTINTNGATSGSVQDGLTNIPYTKEFTLTNSLKREYKVTYNLNDSEGETKSDTLTLTTANTDVVYRFNGWKEIYDDGSYSSTVTHRNGAKVSRLCATDGGTYKLIASFTNQGVTLPTPTRVGYVFDGWYTTSACTTKVTTNSSGKYTPNKNTTVYAHWTPITYNIAFDFNKDSVKKATMQRGSAMDTVSATFDTAQNLQTVSFWRFGYKFAGWNTKADGTGTAFADAASVKNLTAIIGATVTKDGTATTVTSSNVNSLNVNGVTVTLYAQWTPITYYIQYDGNGYTGGSMENQEITYGVSKALTANAFENKFTLNFDLNDDTGTKATPLESSQNTYNYEFQGWAFTSTGKVKYANSYKIKNFLTSGVTASHYDSANPTAEKVVANNDTELKSINKDGVWMKLYAVWDYASIELPTPVRTGYIFDGWYSSKTDFSAANKIGDGGDSYTPTSGITLYAKWTPITYKVEFVANDSSNSNGSTAVTNTVSAINSVTFDQGVSGFPTTQYSRKGYTPNGWNMKADGTGTACTSSTKNLTAIIGATVKKADGTTVVITEENKNDNYNGATVYVYQQWTPVKYYIYFADGTATVYEPQEITFDVPTKLEYSGVQVALTLRYYVNNGIETDPVLANDTKVEVLSWTDNNSNTYDKSAYHTNILFDMAEGNRWLTAVLGNRGSVDSLPTYYKNGYSFAGWYENSSFTGTQHKAGDSFEFIGDNSLYAKWTPVVYDVKFDGNTATSGVPSTITNKTFASGSITLAAAPQKSNTITFDADGGFAVATKTINYTFNCWEDAKGVQYNAATTYTDIYDKDNIAANYTGSTHTEVTLKAKWNTNSYTLPTPVKPGYTFNGWYDTTTNKKITSVDLLEKNISVKAKWTANSYTVTLNGSGNTNSPASTLTTKSFTYNAAQTIDNPFERKFEFTLNYNYPTGYTNKTEATDYSSDFLGWTEDSTNTIKYYSSATATTDYAASAFNAAYYANKYGTEKYNKYAAVTHYAANSSNAKDGTDADNYYVATTGAVTFKNMTTASGATVKLNAKWKDQTYVLPTPTLKGYTFGGWYENSDCTGTQHNAGETVTINANKTFYAKWTPIKYTIAFNGNGATTVAMSSIENVEYDTSVNVTANTFVKTGYLFDGWATQADGLGTKIADKGAAKNLASTNGATATLYAQWKPITYKVIFNGNGSTEGSTSEINPVTYDESFDLPDNGFARKKTVTFEYNGATSDNTNATATAAASFAGWAKSASGSVVYADGVTVSDNLASTQGATVTLYAKWNDGTITLPTPKKTGYHFDGWYKESTFATAVKATDTYSADARIYAKWTPITYYVAYNGNGNTGGSMTEKSTVTYDKAFTLKSNAFSRIFNVSYNLNDQGTDVTAADALTTTSANTTATATFEGWAKSASGTVYFAKDKNGTSVLDNLSSTQGETVNLYAKWTDGTVTLPTPTRTGYKFDCWYTDAIAGTRVSGTTYKPTKDIELFAHWIPITYTIAFNGNGSTSGNVASQTGVKYDTSVVLNSNSFERTGYIFNGWNSKDDGTGTAYKNGQSVKNLASTQDATYNLYAQWTPITYSVAFDGNGKTGGSTAGIDPATYDKSFNLTENGFKREFKVTYVYNNATSGASPAEETAKAAFEGWTLGEKTYGDKELVSNLTATQGEKVTLTAKWQDASVTLPTPKKIGYTFKGWYKSSTFEDGDRIGDAGASFTPTEAITLYAKWEANPYVINYNGNGSTNKTAYSQNRKFDDDGSLTPNEFERVFTVEFNYKDSTENPIDATKSAAPDKMDSPKSSFEGWATSADGEKVYDNGHKGNMITDAETSVDLYAVWDDSQSYIILPQPVRPGFEFLGWYTTDDWTIVENDEYEILREYVYKDIKKKIDNPSYEVTWTMPSDYVLGAYNASWEIPTDWYELPLDYESPNSHYYVDVKERKDYDTDGDGVSDRYEEWYYPTGDITLYARWSDTEAPEVEVVSVTRTSDNSYKLVFNISDNEGITRYFWGQSSSFYSNTETKVDEEVKGSGRYPKNINNVEFVADKDGYYYFTAIDKTGNISSEANTYIFYLTTFETIGGSVSGSDRKLVYKGESIALPDATKAGYTFGGWYSKEYNGNLLKSDAYTPNASAKVYAKWTPKLAEFDISYTTGETEVEVATNLFAPRVDSASSSGVDVSYDDATNVITLNGNAWASTGTLIKSPFKPVSGHKYRMTYEVVGGTATGADLVLQQATPLGSTTVETRDPQKLEFRWTAENSGIISDTFEYTKQTADTVAWLQLVAEKNGSMSFDNYQIKIKVEDITDSEPDYEYSQVAMLLDNEEAVDVPNVYRVGYHQTGWYTAPDSTGTKVEQIQPGSDSMILYVRWDANKYKIVYNFNSTGHQDTSNTVLDTEYTYDVKGDLAENGFKSRVRVTFTPQFPNTTDITAVPPDYLDAYADFLYWSTTPDGANRVDEAYNLTPDNDVTVTLYAIWDAGNITLPTAAKKGLTLLGWYDKAADNQGNRIGGAGSEYTPAADITLYGHWISLGIANKVLVYDFAAGTIGTIFDEETDALEKNLWEAHLILGKEVIDTNYLGSSTATTNIVSGFDGCDYSVKYGKTNKSDFTVTTNSNYYSTPQLSASLLQEWSAFYIELDDGCRNEPITFYFELQFNFNRGDAYQYINGQITLVPANSVYYEETIFKDYDTINEEDAAEEWYNVGSEWNEVTSSNTAQTYLGTTDYSVYGFDSKYNLYEDIGISGYNTSYSPYTYNAAYSNNTAIKATVNENWRNSKITEFKFEGKGFELVSECGPDTSGLMVYVWKQVGSSYKLISNTLVDTRLNDANALTVSQTNNYYSRTNVNTTVQTYACQVPVYQYMSSTRGTYLVQVQAVYLDDVELQGSALESESNLQMLANELESSGLEINEELLEVKFVDEDSVLNGGEAVENENNIGGGILNSVSVNEILLGATSADNYGYIDGIRVYNPTSEEKYYANNEKDARFFNISQSAKINYQYGEYEITDTENHENNCLNEIYLSPRDALNSNYSATAFSVTGFKNDGTQRVMISLRAVKGEPKVYITNSVKVGTDSTPKYVMSIDLPHCAEMYYDVTDCVGSDGSLIIINASRKTDADTGYAAVCNLKITNVGSSLVGVKYLESESVNEVLQALGSDDLSAFNIAEYTAPVYEKYVESEEPTEPEPDEPIPDEPTPDEPTPDEPVVKTPTIVISKAKSSYTVDYRTEINFYATAENIPDGGKIVWYNGTKVVGVGTTYSIAEATSRAEITAKVLNADNTVAAETDSVTINVKKGFFDRLIAFFRNLFKKLPKLDIGKN